MTRLEVIGKALSGSISWLDAAVILGVTARQMRRLRLRYECFGKEGLVDGRSGLSRRRRIPDATVSEVLRLRRELYTDFSIRHLHEHLTERHHLAVSYSLASGLTTRCPRPFLSASWSWYGPSMRVSSETPSMERST